MNSLLVYVGEAQRLDRQSAGTARRPVHDEGGGEKGVRGRPCMKSEGLGRRRALPDGKSAPD